MPAREQEIRPALVAFGLRERLGSGGLGEADVDRTNQGARVPEHVAGEGELRRAE